MSKYTLSSIDRLKSRKTLEKLFSEGDSLFVHPLKLVYLPLGGDTNVKLEFGITVPKRLYKSAVSRNRIKRLVREAYRLQRPAMIEGMSAISSYAIMYIYVHKEEATVAEISSAIKRLHKRFLKTISPAENVQS